MPGGMEWVILLVVVVLLFGAKRLPELARSVGRSARVFRGEIKGLASDGEQTEKAEQSEPAQPAQPAQSAEAPRAALPAGQPAEAAPSAPSVPPTAEAPGVAPAGSTVSSNGLPGGAGSASGPSDRG